MASESSAASDNSTGKFDVFNPQFNDQYTKDFIKGHKIWVENELIPEVRSVFEKCDEYRILSVGSGSGCADVALLEHLTALANESSSLKNQKIKYTVLEPDTKAIALCQRNIQPFSQALNIEFDYKIIPSEKYLMELEDNFELIHFVHVISWVKDPPGILKKCYEKLLKQGGTLAVVDFDPKFDENGHLQCVKVDDIAEENKWNCRKFPNTIMQDFTEVHKRTDKGKKQVASFFGQDLETFTDKEMEEASSHFCSDLQKEIVDGEEKYLSPLRETVYFLTK